jgi:hypothetical protein
MDVGCIWRSGFDLSGTYVSDRRCSFLTMEDEMGRGILLWLLGVPIPIIILLALFWH